MPNPTRRLAGGIAAVAASVLMLAGCTAGTNGSGGTDSTAMCT